ncbi:MAG: amino acid ABC transporter permease [Pseudomonadota bacterium]
MKKKRMKITWLDIIVSLVLLAAGVYGIYRVKVGLHYQWNWGAIPQYLFRFDGESKRWIPNLLVEGLLTTIRLSIWGTILASIIGVVIGLCRVSQSLFKRLLGRTYVEFIRNLPPLVLIFIFYFFLSDQIMAVIGLEGFIQSRSGLTQRFLTLFFAPPPLFTAFLSALITLASFEAAFIAEIVRAGIQSIEKGQWEASYALGLSRWQQMRYIILPQATQRILPPLAGQFISTVKDSAIVSVISIQELTFQGMELMSSTFLRFEIWITIAILYFIMTFSLSLSVDRVETYMRRSEA